MGARVRHDLNSGRFAAAGEAAAWVRAFHPEVTVTLERDIVQLSSDARGDDELRLIWQSALANEILFARAAERRAAMLDTLLA